MNKTAEAENNKRTRKKLGDILCQSGLIDEKTLAEALEIQRSNKNKLGQILIDMGVADDEEIAKALSEQFKLPLLRLENREIPEEVLSTIPAQLAEDMKVVPVEKTDKGLLVAMADPLQLDALGDLRFLTGMPIKIGVASEGQILRAIERHYSGKSSQEDFDTEPGTDEEVEVDQGEGTGKGDVEDTQDLLDQSEQAPVVRFANAILADAIKLKASDIHIEPQRNAVVIRYRIDGIMREIMKPGKPLHAPLVSRIKILSNMDISIRRKPSCCWKASKSGTTTVPRAWRKPARSKGSGSSCDTRRTLRS